VDFLVTFACWTGRFWPWVASAPPRGAFWPRPSSSTRADPGSRPGPPEPWLPALSEPPAVGWGKSASDFEHAKRIYGVEITDESFEDSLARRLHEELDALSVDLPAAPQLPGRVRRYALPGLLVVALIALLMAGSSLASGSPNPVVWVQAAGHSLGLPPRDRAPAENAAEPPESSPEASPKATPKATPKPESETESPGPGHTAQPGESPEPSGPESGDSD
jgi:hypothetical protein